MRKLLLLTILLNATVAFGQDWTLPTEADYPKLEKYGQTVESFVPKSWKTVDKATGDLNGDKIPDAVVVIRGSDAKFINKNDGLGVEEFDTNPRILLVLIRNALVNRYELIEQSNSFIITPDSPTMSEPFLAVKIKNGVLQLDFEIFYSAGSWGTSQASYKFKYTDGEFALIGADKTESARNTGETETRSYNFLTNRMSITTGNFATDTKNKVKWKTYRVGKLKTFRTFAKPFEWEIEPDYFV
jgi:hypothetical protein